MTSYNVFTHLSAVDHFIKEKGHEPFFLSDWNNEQGEVVLPTNVLHSVAITAPLLITKYSETHVVKKVMEKHIEDIVNNYQVAIGKHHALVCGNATAALSLTLLSLTQLMPRVSIGAICPYYYSIDNVCNNIKAPIVKFYLRYQNNFSIDMGEFKKFLVQNKPNCVVLTQPVYCTGILIPLTTIAAVAEACQEVGSWLVIDSAFSGLTWNEANSDWSNASLISLASKYSNTVLIDSPTKRLFLNGLKLGIIYAPAAILERMRYLSDCFFGNISRAQICLLSELYSVQHKEHLNIVCAKNARKAKRMFSKINALGIPDCFSLLVPVTGVHCILWNTDLRNDSVNAMDTALKVLNTREVVVLPTNDFNFSGEDPFGVRVNLMKDSDQIKKAVSGLCSPDCYFGS